MGKWHEYLEQEEDGGMYDGRRKRSKSVHFCYYAGRKICTCPCIENIKRNAAAQRFFLYSLVSNQQAAQFCIEAAQSAKQAAFDVGTGEMLFDHGD